MPILVGPFYYQESYYGVEEAKVRADLSHLLLPRTRQMLTRKRL